MIVEHIGLDTSSGKLKKKFFKKSIDTQYNVWYHINSSEMNSTSSSSHWSVQLKTSKRI